MERRAFSRFETKIKARLLINEEKLGDGIVSNLSASGFGVVTDVKVAEDDRAVLYFEDGTRFEGNVSRLFDGGFAIELGMSETKRDKLAITLATMVENGEEITKIPLERRIAKRAVGLRAEVACHTDSGVVNCHIIDMSLTGAAIETDARLEMGSTIIIGKVRGRVIRCNGSVYGLEFLAPCQTAPSRISDDQNEDAGLEPGAEKTIKRSKLRKSIRKAPARLE